MNDRKKRIAGVMLYADFGRRDGLSELEKETLYILRGRLVVSVIDNRPTEEAEEELKTFYKNLHEVRNGDVILRPEMAARNDYFRALEGNLRFDPHEEGCFRRSVVPKPVERDCLKKILDRGAGKERGLSL